MKFENGHWLDSTMLMDNIQETQSFILAFTQTTELTQNGYPALSLNIIKTTHKHLMSNAREQDKSPRKFRNIQNYICPIIANNLGEKTFITIGPKDLKPTDNA